MPATVPSLLERESELKTLAAQVGRVAAGDGGLVVIRGSAGIGKTSLLKEMRALADGRGMNVLSARASEIERDFPFGLARQLFDRPVLSSGRQAELLMGAAALARPVLEVSLAAEDTPPAAVQGVLHGLYWLTANLAMEQPLLLAIDDVQWSDPSSLRFLGYLGRRVEELPVLVAMTQRTGEPPADPDLLRAVTDDPAVLHVEPGPLSEAAVERLLADALAHSPGPELARACTRATGGNPFLLRQLSHEIDGADPSAVQEMSPPAVAATVMMRIGRMSAAEPALARALSVLGGRAPLADAASLAELEIADAETAAARLADADILEFAGDLQFVHPIVRLAVYGDLDRATRGRLHRRAADLLVTKGRLRDAVPHLLAAPPRGDEQVVEQLRLAAHDAVVTGDPEAAASLLERALLEPPSVEARPALLGELGTAEMRAGLPAAVDHLTEQLELTADPRARARAAAQLGRALVAADRARDAASEVDRALRELGDEDRELALELHSVLASAMYLARDQQLISTLLDRLFGLRPDLSGDTPAERAILATLAMLVERVGADADESARIARTALADGQLLRESGPDSITLIPPLCALIFAERYDEAVRGLSELSDEAGRRGAPFGFVIAAAYTGHVARRRGDLQPSEAESRAALDLARESGVEFFEPLLVGFLVDALTDAGRLDEADAELRAAGFDGELPTGHTLISGLVAARGRLRLAQSQLPEAIADLGDSRERDASGGGIFDFWGAPYVRALALAGRREDALAVAEAERERWEKWGTPRAIGTILAAQGVATGGDDGIELLRQAVERLSGSPCRIDLARAQLDLGSALRRANRRTDARDHLREALDIARRCGASGIADDATEELRAAGGRVHREYLSGVDALTASELRVARLAAEGRSNPEIAQTLFLSRKTVEMHLVRVFRKLDVSARSELPAALER